MARSQSVHPSARGHKVDRTPSGPSPWNRSGQGLIEYVLIVALASVGLILVLILFRNQIGNNVDNASGTVQSVSGSYYVPGGGSAGSTQGGGRGQGGGNSRGGGTGGGQGSGRGGN